jgi:hypothetical protein
MGPLRDGVFFVFDLNLINRISINLAGLHKTKAEDLNSLRGRARPSKFADPA